MNSMLSQRLLRPVFRAPRVVRPCQSFHVGWPSGTSRLQDWPRNRGRDSVAQVAEKQETSTTENEEPRTSEFKKMRIRVLQEAVDSGLLKETHPRLVHGENPMPVPMFRIRSKTRMEEMTLKATTLYGRVRSIRQHGSKLIFVTIVNEFDRVQGMINFGKIPNLDLNSFKLFSRMIENGDHISITGKPTRSSSGELTIEAIKLPELLSPAMEQIPDTLTNPETRSQKRHLDMTVNPEITDTLRLRSAVIKYIRDYLNDRKFLEFQTPILAENAGGAIARSFTTTATEFPSKELSLRIAPELWLKRLVVGGVHRVFEIGPAFRNEGIDGTHNPEFTMCEFYSAYTTLEDLIGTTEALITGLAEHCHELISRKLKSLPPVDMTKFKGPFMQLEFIPALEAALGFRLPKLTGKGAYSELVAMLQLSGVTIPGGVPPTMSKLLDRLAAVYLEPQSFERPLFLVHHPSCMSPLAKSFVCPNTLQLVSARTELFINGRELANMYEEENDPTAQALKLSRHRALRSSNPGEEEEPERDAPLDTSYIKALEAGLPPTGGWGCGIERLVMLFSGSNRINDCLSFGTLKNVVGLTSEDKNGSKS